MAVKVLQVLNGLGHGGAEAFVMNMYRNIDRGEVQFDFLVRSTDNSNYEEEVKQLGGKIYVTAPFPKNVIKNWTETKYFFKIHRDYDIVHVHANSLLYLLPLKLAKKYGVKCRIIHSHNTRSAKKVYNILHNYNKRRVKKYTTDYFACSKIAGEWMFNSHFNIIKNAIDTNKFRYNRNMRNELRKELNISNKFVVGHVGRFTHQKNHAFLIEVFKEILKCKNDAILVLIGDGELRSEVYEKVRKLGIEDNVVFCGSKGNVADYLNIFDVFLFPSYFEGLPIALIEAQASGIPCVISDTISDEILVTDLVHRKSLKSEAREWAEEIINLDNGYERKDRYQEIVDAGFDMNHSVQELQNFYLNSIKL